MKSISTINPANMKILLIKVCAPIIDQLKAIWLRCDISLHFAAS